MSIREVSAWGNEVHINCYGPAECYVCFTLQPNITAMSDLRDVGYPIGGDSWVVNPADYNQLVPIDAVGELVLGAPSVGRGYINNPAANAESFITSPPQWLEQFRVNRVLVCIRLGISSNMRSMAHYVSSAERTLKSRFAVSVWKLTPT